MFKNKGKNLIATLVIASLFMGQAAFAGPVNPPIMTAPLSVNTLPVTSVTQSTATFSGYFTSPSAGVTTWFIYGTSINTLYQQTTHVSSLQSSGNFTANVTGLTQNTTYFVKAVAQNATGIVISSTAQSFTTSPIVLSIPTINTLPPSGATANSCVFKAYVTNAPANADVWFQYNTTSGGANLLTNDTQTAAGNQMISITATGLTANTNYTFKAYLMSNGTTTVAPTSQTCTTLAATISSLSVSTMPIASKTETSAVLQGYLAFIGTPNAATRQFKWGTSSTALTNTLSVSGTQSTNGIFSDTLSGLTPNTMYYYKACATNASGTQYCAPTTSSFTTLPTTTVTYQCNDGIDNDSDGWIDYPADPGCTSGTDDTESPNPTATYQCNDGYDNDGDGLIDANDPGCTSATDNDETNSTYPTYQCNDGIDNDYDGYVDYPSDSGCNSLYDDTEANTTTTYQCNDGYDNDGDGLTDLADPACAGNPAGITEYPVNNGGCTYNCPPPPPCTYNCPVNPYNPPPVLPNYDYPVKIVYVNGGQGYVQTDTTSLLSLTLTTPYNNVYKDDYVSYTLGYKNMSTTKSLQNVTITVRLPQDLAYMRSQSGIYDSRSQTLTIDLGTLTPGEAGTFYFEAQVLRLTSRNSLTTEAIGSYTVSGIHQEVRALATLNGDYENNNSLLGLALFAGDGFLPTTGFGWIILILIILGLVYLVRKMYRKAPSQTYMHQ